MRQLTVIACLSFVFLGCAALLPRPEPPREVTYARPDDERDITREEAEGVFDPGALGRYEVGVIRSGEFDAERPLELTSYARAMILASMLEAFELSRSMTEEQRRDLYDALFRDVPTGTDGTFRAVVIGHYFRSGEPLYILLGISQTPYAAGVPDGTAYTLFYQSSALAGSDGVATYAEGRFVDMAVNISWIYAVDATGSVRNAEASVVPITVARPTQMSRIAADVSRPFDDRRTGAGEATRDGERAGEALYDEASGRLPGRFDPGRYESLPVRIASRERVRLAYRILDRASAVDISRVPRLVEPVLADASEEPWLRVEAGFAAFLFELHRGNLGAAEQRLEMLTRLVEKLGHTGDRLYDRVTALAPALLEAIEYEVEYEPDY